ncbi:hypothetical protein FHS41_001335 [Streptomyces violarus]|uniref:Uncharacterized protein n=1 Tax=Streptomyces violarus TaxID=67380 RepID=A0A7W5EZV7_9ACTN|nr:hypothetical protein [Streptomyces violarus]
MELRVFLDTEQDLRPVSAQQTEARPRVIPGRPGEQ